MLILHAGFFANRLLLWGEIPGTTSVHADRPRRGRSKTASPPPFPYDAGHDDLLKVVKEAGLALPAGACQCENAIARLPTQKEKPLASNPLIAESPVASASTAISPGG